MAVPPRAHAQSRDLNTTTSAHPNCLGPGNLIVVAPSLRRPGFEEISGANLDKFTGDPDGGMEHSRTLEVSGRLELLFDSSNMK